MEVLIFPNSESKNFPSESWLLLNWPTNRGPADHWVFSNVKPNGFHIAVPHWFLIMVSATIAAIPLAPWLRLRFSLRTLLLATTLIAVVLGIIVWMSRAN
jgi:hypothetical protein